MVSWPVVKHGLWLQISLIGTTSILLKALFPSFCHRVDNKVDGGLPLEKLLTPNPELRAMIESMKVGKKWLFTNAGENVSSLCLFNLSIRLFHFYPITNIVFLHPISFNEHIARTQGGTDSGTGRSLPRNDILQLP